MKYILLTLLFVSPFVVSAEIYKCEQVDGKLGFSDKPCLKGAAEERITVKVNKSDWVSRLRNEKSSSIKITDVLRKDGDVSIKYEFKNKSDSNGFLRLAKNVSNMPVVLMKYLEPKESVLGRAEIKASNKTNPLFDKLKRAKN
jgi:hypothetical protein